MVELSVAVGGLCAASLPLEVLAVLGTDPKTEFGRDERDGSRVRRLRGTESERRGRDSCSICSTIRGDEDSLGRVLAEAVGPSVDRLRARLKP